MNCFRKTGIILLAIGCSLISCRKEEQTPSVVKPQYDVMLISIDTLRADALRLYDPRGVETPHMEELARNSVLFRHAVSQVPYTLPSHCTMLTGSYPVGHGVKDNVHDSLPQSVATIAEIFKKQGYQTAGFVGSLVLGRKTGLARGFDTYDDFFSRADVRSGDLGGVERRAQDVLASFEHWFEKTRRSGKSFMFLHFYDPHSPYSPPPGFAAASSQKDLYLGEVRYVDHVLGDLFSYLKAKGVWDRTVILLTSDHGEMLEEHDEIGHGYFLYQPALSVPMILRIPGSDGRSVDDLVQVVDIAPTLLETVQIQPAGMQGESLLAVAGGSAHKKNRYAFAESYFAALQMGVSPIFSIQDGTLKYIESPRPELYDLASDSGESRNLTGERKSEAKQLQTRIQQYLKAYSNPNLQAETHRVSAEEAEQFAALGYLGGQVSESSWDRKKDPKDYIQEWNRSLEATTLVDRGRHRDALKLIGEIRQSGSLPAESVTLLEARCYLGLGDVPRAEQVLKAAGNTPGALNELAGIYARTGRLKEANDAYEKVLQMDFSYFALYDYVMFLKGTDRTQDAIAVVRKTQAERKDADLGRPFFAEMYLLLGQWPDAENILESLLQERPWESKWYVELSGAYQNQGKVQQALNLLEPQWQRFDADPEFVLRLGILYNASGQKSREISVFQKMMDSWPSDCRGYFYLAKAMLDTGQDPGAVIGLVRRGLSLEPRLDLQVFGHYLLGNALEATGQKAESRKEFELAQKIEKQLQAQ